MSAASKFASDPKKFISENILLVLHPQVIYPDITQIDSKLRVRFMLQDMQEQGLVIRPGPKKRSSFFGLRSTEVASAKGIYQVVPAAPNARASDTFLAYVCPYKPNQGSMMYLGSDANIMITAEMSGCTFGVGSADPKTGSRMVMHANADYAATGGDDAGVAPQALEQADMIRTTLKKGHWFAPDQYRKFDELADINVAATVIGVRSSSPPTWNFYSQTYNKAAEDYTLLSNTKIC